MANLGKRRWRQPSEDGRQPEEKQYVALPEEGNGGGGAHVERAGAGSRRQRLGLPTVGGPATRARHGQRHRDERGQRASL